MRISLSIAVIMLFAATPTPSPARDREASAAPVAVLKGFGGTVAEFSADGKTLLTAGGDSARVWDAATFRPMSEPMGHFGKINTAAFSPDAARVLTTGLDGTARVWDAATGKPICEVKHRMSVVTAAFSHDGREIVTGSDDKTARVWDATTGKELLALQFKSGVYEVAFNRAGDRILTMSFSKVSLFDRATGKLTASEQKNGGEVSSYAAFSPDGSRVATAGESSACIFDAGTGEKLAQAQVLDPDSTWGVDSVAFSPDGKKLATSTTGFARIWDAASGKPLSPKLAGEDLDYFQKVMFSGDGKRVFAAGNSALHDRNVWAVWDVETGRRIMLLRVGSGAKGFAISPDGTKVAGGGAEPRDTAIWTVE
jgi:WD40 repeat protein